MVSEIISFMSSVDGSGLTLGFGITACVVSFSVLLYNYKKTQKITQKLLRLERELHAAQGSAIGMGQQLIMMEKQLGQKGTVATTESRVPQNTKKSERREPKQNHTDTNRIDTSGDDSIYDQARQALQQGLSVADVAKQCGLSYAEVSLLQSLSKSTISSC